MVTNTPMFPNSFVLVASVDPIYLSLPPVRLVRRIELQLVSAEEDPSADPVTSKALRVGTSLGSRGSPLRRLPPTLAVTYRGSTATSLGSIGFRGIQTGQGRARQGKARQGKARQGKARQGRVANSISRSPVTLVSRACGVAAATLQ
ncbi:hypothetical protein HJFPF1_01874 [Paramyrothecium foliicola]|nr:hypothetical protein HJFPF1_01874 [Paramyrothecium foliicola]